MKKVVINRDNDDEEEVRKIHERAFGRMKLSKILQSRMKRSSATRYSGTLEMTPPEEISRMNTHLNLPFVPVISNL